MAKKQKPSMTDLFNTTTAEGGEGDIIKARGVGLKVSEWGEVEAIAGELGMTPHAVSAYLLRYGLKAYRAGKIKPETKTKKITNLPEL